MPPSMPRSRWDCQERSSASEETVSPPRRHRGPPKARLATRSTRGTGFHRAFRDGRPNPQNPLCVLCLLWLPQASVASWLQEFPTPEDRLRPRGSCGKGNMSRSTTSRPPAPRGFRGLRFEIARIIWDGTRGGGRKNSIIVTPEPLLSTSLGSPNSDRVIGVRAANLTIFTS